MNLFLALRTAVEVFWGVGNAIARRVIWAIVLWPFFLLAVDTQVPWWATTIVALVPLLVVLVRVFARHMDPLVVPVAALQKGARKALAYLWTVIGLEFAWGAFLAVLPTSQWKLALLLVLTLVAAAFLHFGHKADFNERTKKVLLQGAGVLVFCLLCFGIWSWTKEHLPRTAGVVATKAARADQALAAAMGESAPTTTTTVYMVGPDPVEILVPRLTWFDWTTDAPLEWELMDGKKFQDGPGIYVKMPDDIPGYSLKVRCTEKGKVARVTFFTTPK